MSRSDRTSPASSGPIPEQRIGALKHVIRKIPLIGSMLASLYVKIATRRFSSSADYWDNRYGRGGTSGTGSYGELAKFKAETLNDLVARNRVVSVIEFGCGDGNQLKLADYPDYLGLDVSPRAVEMCRAGFGDDPTKRFQLSWDYDGEQADLAMSLDVVFHLVEDEVYFEYMHSLFAAARRFVVIYSSNTDVQESPRPPHVRHRRFTDWVAAHAPDWTLVETIANRYPYDPVSGSGSPASFFVFARRPDVAVQSTGGSGAPGGGDV